MVLFPLCSVIDSVGWFWIGRLLIIMEFLKALFLVLHFFYYILMTFLMILSVILLYWNAALCFNCDQASDLWQQQELTSELESDIWDTGLGQEVGCWFYRCKKINWFCLISIITLVLYMWKWMGLSSRKNHFLKNVRVDFLFWPELELLHYL